MKGFNQYFYPVFDNSENGYTLYSEGERLNEYEILGGMDDYFNNNMDEFISALNNEFRSYCRFSHTKVRYDYFPYSMKHFLERKYDHIYLHHIQKMNTKELFELFEGGDFEFLFYVASHIFYYEFSETKKTLENKYKEVS